MCGVFSTFSSLSPGTEVRASDNPSSFVIVDYVFGDLVVVNEISYSE